MKLSDGFIVGGRYRVAHLLAVGSQSRVYVAQDEEEGAGPVALKVARHRPGATFGEIEAGREVIEHQWQALRTLYGAASSTVPVPIELVRMYPGESAVRKALLPHKERIRQEPYLVCELMSGESLAAVLQGGQLDEERALMIALRAALIARGFVASGFELIDFAPSNFVLDSAGENLTLVDLSGVVRAEPGACPEAVRVPIGFGRLLVGLLAAVPAPDWRCGPEQRGRWETLIDERRIPREFRDFALGTLGYQDAFDATLDRVEQRLRALVRARRARVHPSKEKKSDAGFPLASGVELGRRFEITGTLAQGGRGFIYEVKDHRSGVDVLAKANKYAYDSGSEFALELPTRRLELAHEYEVMKRFASRSGMLPQPLALVHDLGQGSWFDLAPNLAANEPFVAMKRIRGIPLLDLLPEPLRGYDGATRQDNRLRPGFVLRLITQIADLLALVHEDGFLFQDLKPENILYDPDSENIFLVDLASACPRLPNGELDKTSVAFGMQTHGFAAPEFADLWEKCDERFDIYSLGATAFHLLTGVNPERVAIMTGEEYPVLDLRAMTGVPDPVARIVAQCLAPLESRFESAREVHKAAEASRLWLSRARPLDVQGARVDYEADGVTIRWDLPNDPRIGDVRVRRVRPAAEEPVYQGPPTNEVRDLGSLDGDRIYLVETALERRGEWIHSRGVEVRAEAFPAPVLFEVTPYFGGNRIAIELAAHSEAPEIRFSTESPPVAIDEGSPVDCSDAGPFVHAIAPGEMVHYAAFARYAGGLSAPRFDSSAALPALPSVSAERARQSDAAVELSWSVALRDAFVEVEHLSGDAPTRVLPASDIARLSDSDAGADAELRYTLVVERAGIRSEPLATWSILRWPELPSIEWSAELEGISLTLSRCSDRVAECDVGIDAVQRFSLDAFPVTLPVEPWRRQKVRFQALVDGSEDGPSTEFEVAVPGRDAGLSLDIESSVLPLRVAALLDGRTSELLESLVLELRVDGSIVETREVETGGTCNPERFIYGDVNPGARVDVGVVLKTESGSEVAHAEVSLRALEVLPPPVCEPLLGAIEVSALDALSRAELSIWRETTEVEEESRVELPARLEFDTNEALKIRWRRPVDDAPMPWSEYTAVTTLERPPRPKQGWVTKDPHGLRIGWAGLDDTTGVTYRVRALTATNRLVYEGEANEIVDAERPTPTHYAIVSVRHGLESEALEVEHALALDGSHALERRDQRPSLMATREARVRQSGIVRGMGIAELIVPRPPVIVAVVEGDDEDALNRASKPRPSEGFRSILGPHLGTLFRVDRTRTLVPWLPRASRARILVAHEAPGNLRWHLAGELDTKAQALLVGAGTPRAERLQLLPFRGELREQERVLTVFDRMGAERDVLLDECEPLTVPGAGRGSVLASVGHQLDGASALGLAASERPLIMVSMSATDLPSEIPSRLWLDAATGLIPWILEAAVEELGASVATAHFGWSSRLHLLIRGEHAMVEWRVGQLRRGGRVRYESRIQSRRGGDQRKWTVSLTDPTHVVRHVVPRVVAWMRKVWGLKPDRGESELRRVTQ